MLPKTWDLLRQNLRSLYPDSALQSDAAIATLRHLLGEDFIEEAWKNGHPFIDRWAFNSSWIPAQLEWLVERISAFERNPSFKTLRHELRLRDRADERLHVLEQAYRFQQAGLHIAFDRKVVIDGRNRCPDITATSPCEKDTCVVELTAMVESRAIAQDGQIFDRIARAIRYCGPLLPYGGKLHRQPPEAEIEKIISEIGHLSEGADLKAEIGVLQIEGLIDFIVGGKGQEEVVATWLKARKLEVYSFNGPPVGQHEPSRIIGKIREKVQQLPEGTFNTLIILTSPLSSRSRTLQSETELIEALTAELKHHPKISLLVIDAAFPFHYETWEKDPAFHWQTYEPFHFRRLILSGANPVSLAPETRAMMEHGLRGKHPEEALISATVGRA